MATLSQTASSVQPTGTTTFKVVTAGATITAGVPVYLDASDASTAKPCNRETLATSVCVGIAMHGAADGQPLTIATSGDINPGGVMVSGESYYIGGNGLIGTYGDIVATEYVTLIGVATTATNLKLEIEAGQTVMAS